MWLGLFAVACVAEPPMDPGGTSTAGEPTGTQSSGSGSGSAQSSGSAESTTQSGGSIDLDCLDPQPVMQLDGVTPSGFVVCSDGFVQRVEAVVCVVPDMGDCGDCGSDCSDGPLGRCMSDQGLGTCSCVYSCETDADCGEGQACACTGPFDGVPRCVPAGCTTTGDCGEGLCGLSNSGQCDFDERLACLDASAECRITTCEGGADDCVCYAEADGYRCHDECFTGCG